MDEVLFRDSHGGLLTLPQVVSGVLSFMEADPKRQYAVTVGTDSELLADKTADFVSAVVVHRVGNGGRYFWRRAAAGPFYTLRDRIIDEVLRSLALGTELLETLQSADLKRKEEQKEPLTWSFAIHADVGEVGPTRMMIQEVVGMIRAHNFDPYTKPWSYAASYVADRHI
jgi:predicted RNase H-related nuclease YkuK (DUF458 family)